MFPVTHTMRVCVMLSQLSACSPIGLQKREDAAWSESFLRSSLQVIRGNRRRLMSSLKTTELKNREHAVEDIIDFVTDMTNPDRATGVIKTALQSGLI